MTDREIELIHSTILAMQLEEMVARRANCQHQFDLHLDHLVAGGGQYLNCSNGCGRKVYLKYEVNVRA